MIKIAICDDCELHRDKTRSIVLRAMKRLETEIYGFEGPDKLIKAVTDQSCLPDIAILDINMDGMDGISLAKQINELLPSCRIIFLSAYLSYAQDVYNVDHVWFILKHDAEVRMEAALSKAVSLIKQDRGDSAVFIKTENGPKLVRACDIIYIERQGLKTDIVCTDERLTTSKNPAALIEQIPDVSFVRCHQSRWINLEHITGLDKDVFILSNDERLPISRTYRTDARQMYFNNI